MGDKAMQPLTIPQNSVCKPCISLHKDLDSNRENAKATSGNKNGIVRSSYFLKRPIEAKGKENESDAERNDDNKLESFASKRTCEKEKRVAVRIPYFWPSIKHNANGQIGDVLEKYSFHIHSSEFSDVDDDGESKRTAEYPKHRVNSFFEETSVNENNQSKEMAVSSIADESHTSSLKGVSTNNSLQCTAKRRKIAQTESPRDPNDNNWRSGCTSDLEEEEEAQVGKFGCDVSHLGTYSNIADKSMEKLVVVISSSRYNSSGSRASGLRAPLKDIKNNCMRR